MRIRPLTAFLAMAALVLACEQQPAEETGETMEPTESTVDIAAEQEALRALADSYETAFAAKDIEALSAMFADDAVWIQHDGVEHSGVQAIRDSYTRDFEGTSTQSLEINPDEIVVAASGDIAYTVGSATFRGTTTDGAPIEQTTRHLVTFRKDNSAWKLVHAMGTAPLAPEGGAPAGR